LDQFWTWMTTEAADTDWMAQVIRPDVFVAETEGAAVNLPAGKAMVNVALPPTLMTEPVEAVWTPAAIAVGMPLWLAIELRIDVSASWVFDAMFANHVRSGVSVSPAVGYGIPSGVVLPAMYQIS